MRHIIEQYRKLRENDAFGILLHPPVIRNYLLYQRELSEKPVVMRSHPPGIEIEMTNRCNLACTQCLRSLGLKPYKLGDMDPENYKRILAQFPYAMNIVLNGFGEPMMYDRFFDIVTYTRRQLPWAKIGIYSNGMLIDETKAYRLMDCGLTELSISIDAATPDTYRRVRRGGDLETLHDNIRRLVRVKQETRARFPMLGLNFVMVNDNSGELVPFIEQAHDLGVDFINCVSWATYDWGFRNRRSKDSYLMELGRARQRMDALGVRCKSMPSGDTSWTDADRPFGCDFFWGENFRVTWDGHITLGCCTPFQEQYSYGSLLDRPFQDIWNGAEFQMNRRMARDHVVPNAVCASCQRFAHRFFAQTLELTEQ